MSGEPRVLVIDDEPQIRRAMRTILTGQDYKVSVAATGEEGLALAAAVRPDIVILDLGLPDLPGVEVCKRLRVWADMPVIVLSAHDSDADKVAALDAGADDYLTKPFSVDELLARLRVGLRHLSKANTSRSMVTTTNGLQIDLANHMVTQNGEYLRLTATEYKLLAYLAGNAGRLMTHQAILNHVWGYSETSQMEYLRVYIRQLRQKIEADPHNPQIIITESGIGYRFLV